MNVLVLGSGGFIGARLTEHLERQRWQVSARSSKTGWISPHRGELADDFSIPGGTDVVIYLAQSPYYRQMPEHVGHLINVNVRSALMTAEKARTAGVTRFIYTSTGNVYAPSFEPLSESAPVRRDDWYALSKLQAEEGLALFSDYMDVHALRLFGVYGPGQSGKLVPNLLARVRAGEAVSIERNPDDEKDLDGLALSLCYIDDLLRVIELTARSGGPRLMNVAGPDTLSIRTMTRLMARALGTEPRFDVLQKYRKGNLLADVARLQSVCRGPFTDFDKGLSNILNGGDCSFSSGAK